MKPINKQVFTTTLLTLLMISISGFAGIELPHLIGSNMVLQRETQTTIWGTASPGEKIAVSFRGNTFNSEVNLNGKWKVKIETGIAGGPFNMLIKGNNTSVELDNILVGDVWLCSGQSNMEWPLTQTDNAEEFINQAHFSHIRLFTVQRNASAQKETETAPATWNMCTPESVAGFSAVGYHFGKALHRETGVPVGLIHSSWGGTRIEPWISEELASTDPDMAEWLKGLNELDIETMAKEQAKIFEAYHVKLKKVESPEYTHEFIGINYNDNSWEQLPQPGLWENHSGYENFDGVVWFRKTFELPEGFDTNNALLSLARIDDTDITWLNGTRVGSTYNQYNQLRNYKIPFTALKPGRNQLVVRVEDYSGGGGFHGDAAEMFISDGTTSISLAGLWKLKKDDTPVPHNPLTLQSSALMPNQFPTLLFNGMINPVINFSIKGAIWYQGESNADAMSQALKYEDQMRMLIADWRKQWNNPGLSFYMVQLANFKEEAKVPRNDVWPFLREAQANVAIDKGVEMACIIDIGEADDIHPRNKHDVGERLALNALRLDYGLNVINNGPRFSSVQFNGNSAIIEFNTMGSDLKNTCNTQQINGFAVAGPDKAFHYAEASLSGENSVKIISNKVDNIVAVRFLWADNPGEVNLYNTTGLPAEPFRTDKW